MRESWIGLCKLATRTRKETKCSNGGCEESIKVGEQYYQTIRGKPPKVWTRQFHLDCVSPWLNYLAKRRESSEALGGRPEIRLSPELKEVRKRLTRRIRYLFDKMKKVGDTLEEHERVDREYGDAIIEVETKTGIPWTPYDTEKRQAILSKFRSDMKSFQRPEYIVEQWKSADQKPLPVSTTFTEAVETLGLSEERKAELDQIQNEILERVARGYVRIPEDEGGDYLV